MAAAPRAWLHDLAPDLTSRPALDLGVDEAAEGSPYRFGVSVPRLVQSALQLGGRHRLLHLGLHLRSTISFGVPFGAHSPYQVATW